jgi:predicted house-cleaning noncanonical NTP pyrophosphatase (MazG superfamily)
MQEEIGQLNERNQNAISQIEDLEFQRDKNRTEIHDLTKVVSHIHICLNMNIRRLIMITKIVLRIWKMNWTS